MALGVVIVLAWPATIAAGLGRLVLGSSPAPVASFLLHLPGVLLGAALIAVAATRRLRLHAPRWVPTTPTSSAPPIATSRPPDPDAQAPLMSRARPPRMAEPLLAIVHLGPEADPAWAAWGLRWEAPGHGAGFVPLPSAARVILGRDPGAHIVARLDQVSWHHLELDVQEARVIAFDLGSSNGTRSDEALVARAPWPWEPGTTLHLASPTALTLTLEPLR